MAVIINDLEVVLEPTPPESQQTVKPPAPQKPFSPQDFLTLMEREQRNRLRVQAH
jgi:hypothetical protein